MRTRRSNPRGGYLRLSGTLVMVGLVLVGFSVGALYYSYKEPRVRAKVQAELALAPTTAEGRVDQWLKHGTPQVHHNLSVFARISAEQPWIVTHTVEAGDGGPPYVYGIDVSELPHDLLHREELVVVLTLAAPSLLGRARLGGDSTEHIPHYAAEIPASAAEARLREIVDFLLHDLIVALEKDIDGARFELRIGA